MKPKRSVSAADVLRPVLIAVLAVIIFAACFVGLYVVHFGEPEIINDSPMESIEPARPGEVFL